MLLTSVKLLLCSHSLSQRLYQNRLCRSENSVDQLVFVVVESNQILVERIVQLIVSRNSDELNAHIMDS